MSTITQTDYSTANGEINLKPVVNTDHDVYDEENVFNDDENLSVEKLKKRSPIKSILNSPSIRVMIFLGMLFFILVAWAIIAVSGSSEVVQEKRDGVAMINIDPQKLDKTNINKEQAKHLMILQQQEAERLNKEGKSNAATLAIQTNKDARNDPNNKVEVGQFSTIGLQTQGRRQAAPGEDLSDNSRYVQSSDPQTGRVIFIEKSSNVIIDPAPSTPAFRAAYQTNANFNGGATGGNGLNGSNNGGYNNGGNGGGNANLATNNNQDQNGQYNQQAQNGQTPQNGQVNQNVQQQQQAPRPPDEDITRLEQQSSTGYQAYLDQQQAITQQMQQEQQNRINAAQQLAQQRQQLANQSISNAIQKLNIGRSSQGGFAAVPYLPSDYSSSSNSNFKGVPYTLNGQTPTNPYNDSINGVSVNQATNNGLTADGKLPSNIIRAGTTWGVVIENTVNSDNAGYVIGRLTSGKYAGSKVYGAIEPSGRNIGISFTAIQPSARNRPLIPINAIAMTIGSESSVASKVNRHYASNYGTMLLTSIIGGYGQAYTSNANAGVTTISPTGIVVQDNTKNNITQEIRGQVYSQLAAQLQADIARFGARPPTFIINQGTPLQMVLLSNLDTKASTDNLNQLKTGGLNSKNGQQGQNGGVGQQPNYAQTQNTMQNSNY